MPKNHGSLEINMEVDGVGQIIACKWPTFAPGVSDAISDPIISRIDRAEYCVAICVNTVDAESISIELRSQIESPFEGPPPFIGWGSHPEVEPFWLYVINALTRNRPRLLQQFKDRQVLLILHPDDKHFMLTFAWSRGSHPVRTSKVQPELTEAVPTA